TQDSTRLCNFEVTFCNALLLMPRRFRSSPRNFSKRITVNNRVQVVNHRLQLMKLLCPFVVITDANHVAMDLLGPTSTMKQFVLTATYQITLKPTVVGSNATSVNRILLDPTNVVLNSNHLPRPHLRLRLLPTHVAMLARL
ncbi:unnamed protein product, partial [Aphanomyces euteiches]